MDWSEGTFLKFCISDSNAQKVLDICHQYSDSQTSNFFCTNNSSWLIAKFRNENAASSWKFVNSVNSYHNSVRSHPFSSGTNPNLQIPNTPWRNTWKYKIFEFLWLVGRPSIAKCWERRITLINNNQVIKVVARVVSSVSRGVKIFEIRVKTWWP